jgi:hypothetical protein
MRHQSATVKIEEAKEEEKETADFLLPVRRRAADLAKAGRWDEAGRILSGIRKILEMNEPRRIP